MMIAGQTPFANADPPATLSHNWDAITAFHYRMFSVGQSSTNVYPVCGRSCQYLFRAEQTLDPSDPTSQKIWRQLYSLGGKTRLFKLFNDYSTPSSPQPFPAQDTMEENVLGEDVPNAPAAQYVGSQVPGWSGQSGRLVSQHTLLVYASGGHGVNGTFYSTIEAPTLGFQGPGGSTQTGQPIPTPPPGWELLTATAWGGHWEGNDFYVEPDGEVYTFFHPLTFDGPPKPVEGSYQGTSVHRYTSLDPGIANAKATTVDELTTQAADYPELITWLNRTMSEPGFAAETLQPMLMFDQGERWRPLNVDSFLKERNGAGAPIHCVGTDRAHCVPLTGLDTLREHYSPDDRIIEGSAFNDGIPHSPDEYESPNYNCNRTPSGASQTLLDCDDGPAASIYYNATTSSNAYNYFDYWFYYRFNELPHDNHEADWEHVSVAQSRTDPSTFDWVNYFTHAYSTSSSVDPLHPSAYLRDDLRCDDGAIQSCGITASPSGSRVWVFVAGGSHASYPGQCRNLCVQPNGVPEEGDHGGESPWSQNGNINALLPFPASSGWGDPLTAGWTDWPGRWGQEGAPASPGSHTEFRCPWSDNASDPSGCAATKRRVTAHAAITRATSRCSAWYGASVTAAACSPSIVRSAVRKARVGHSGEVTLVVPHARSASGAGIAQAVGDWLVPGARVQLRGRPARDTEVIVRARYGKRTVKSWTLRHLPVSGGGLAIVLPGRASGQPRVIVG